MLDHIIAEITGIRTNLIDCLRAVPEELFGVRPREDDWSIGEVVAHLCLVEQGIERLLNGLLERMATDAVTASRAATDAVAVTLPPLPPEKIRASDRATPERPFEKAGSFVELTACRAGLLEVARRSAPYDLTGASFPHRVLGDLNFGQWLLFTGIHERRHLEQIERITETLSGRS